MGESESGSGEALRCSGGVFKQVHDAVEFRVGVIVGVAGVGGGAEVLHAPFLDRREGGERDFVAESGRAFRVVRLSTGVSLTKPWPPERWDSWR